MNISTSKLLSRIPLFVGFIFFSFFSNAQGRKVKLKKVNDPKITAINNQVQTALILDTLLYLDDVNGGDLIRERSIGRIGYSIKNTSQTTFTDLKTKVLLPKTTQIQIIQGEDVYVEESGKRKAATVLKSGGRIQGISFIKIGFELPPDSLEIEIQIESLSGIKVASFRAGIPTKSRKIVEIPAELFPNRKKLIDNYHGINSNISQNIAKGLESLVKAGDKKSQLWAGILTYLGKGGYEADEQLAYKIIRDQNCFDNILPYAQNNDPEAMYLIAMCYYIGFQGHKKEEADHYLIKSAKAGYRPAIYAKALHEFEEKRYPESFADFQNALQLGVKLSTFNIARFYEGGLFVSKDEAKALKMYEEAANTGSQSALLKLSEFYAKGVVVKADLDKAISYAERATSDKNNLAKVCLANLLISRKEVKFIRQAFRLNTEAAESGNRDAMFNLGILLLYGKVKAETSNMKGIDYVKRSAFMGHAYAMNLLGTLYFEGRLIEKNAFLSRYWLNQAKRLGVGIGKEDKTTFNPIDNFAKGFADYTPSQYYEIVNQYNQVVESGYADDALENYVLAGLGNVFMESRRQKQEVINDIKLIYERKGIRTYGGIISSSLDLPCILQQNARADIYACGKVNFGTFATLFNGGFIGPEGSTDSDLRMFNRVSKYRHGAVLACLNDGKWIFVGSQLNNFTNESGSNNLHIIINDADYTNNEGYFDLRVDIFN